MAEIAFIVIVTIIVSALIASLPFPSPGMFITKPANNTSFIIDYNTKNDSLGVTVDVNISVNKGYHRYILYGSEFLQRLMKKLSLAPSIWVMVHKHSSIDEWIPYEEVHDLGDKSGSASVTLYSPNETWSIALVSLNNYDAQYFRGYLAVIKEIGTFQRGKPFPESGIILDEVVVRTSKGKLRST